MCLVLLHTNSVDWENQGPVDQGAAAAKKKGLKIKIMKKPPTKTPMVSEEEGEDLGWRKWGLCRETNARRWRGPSGNPTTGLLISSFMSQKKTKPKPFDTYR